MKPTVAPEFSRPLPVDRVRKEGSLESISGDEEERAALARRFDLPAIFSLSAELNAEPWRGGGLRVTGAFIAEIEQICVVTLDPFRSRLEGPVERVFMPDAGVEHDGNEDAEILIGGTADLGELVAETLALWLDPYPRKPGVSFVAPDEPDLPCGFAGLAVLRDKSGGST